MWKIQRRLLRYSHYVFDLHAVCAVLHYVHSKAPSTCNVKKQTWNRGHNVRDQDQGLELRGQKQDQELQKVSTRTPRLVKNTQIMPRSSAIFFKRRNGVCYEVSERKFHFKALEVVQVPAVNYDVDFTIIINETYHHVIYNVS